MKSHFDHFQQFLSFNISHYLDYFRTSHGVKSGNMAMFLAINLLYLRDYLGIDTSQSLYRGLITIYPLETAMVSGVLIPLIITIPKWISSIWDTSLPQFTSFWPFIYHQSYLEFIRYWWPFCPYPGGGGCYDYDAISLITLNSQLSRMIV